MFNIQWGQRSAIQTNIALGGNQQKNQPERTHDLVDGNSALIEQFNLKPKSSQRLVIPALDGKKIRSQDLCGPKFNRTGR